MEIFNSIFKDVAIDLGTANTLVYVRGRGLAMNEPTVAAVNTKTNQILAIGEDAKKMLGRTPAHINVVRPLVGGVVSDFDVTQDFLTEVLKKLKKNSLFGFRRAIVAIPNNLTEVERKSVEDATLNAGCSKVYLVDSPIAAALGAGLPIDEPTASLIIDIGGGTTDIAVISMGGTVVSKTLKIAGDKFNEDIMRFVRDEFKMAIGESTAEMAKIIAGSAVPLEDRLEAVIRGRDFSNGLPREIGMKNSQVRQAISKSLKMITEAIHEVIETTPPELVGDMLKQGIYVCGGGGLLRGLDQLIAKEVEVETIIADDPLTCVVRGLGRIIDNFDRRQELLDGQLKAPTISL